jgi:hypothetical protein
VLKKSADEFFSSNRREPDAISRRLLVLESESALFKLQDSVVADGDSKDVRREILECSFPRSNWFQVDYSLLLPYAFVDSRKEAGLLQLISNLRAEDDVERFAWNEKPIAGRFPAAVFGEPAAGHDVVNVWVVLQGASPGVEHADHSDSAADEPRIERQFLQSLR